jgi:hypothetical protein
VQTHPFQDQDIMTRMLKLLAPALLLGAALALPARAQTPLPLAFEVRGGVGFPVSDFDDGASMGWIVGATVRYHTNAAIDLYGGFDFASFPPDDDVDFGEADVDFRDFGVRAGVRTNLQFAVAPAVVPWLEAGLLVNRTSVKGSVGDVSATVDADWALGAEAGAGVSIPIGPRAALTPGVRFRTHKADFGDELGDTTVSYFVVDLGVLVRL